MRELVSDYKPHAIGEREVADWDRLVDGQVVTYRDVPFIYLREVSMEDYLAQHPTVRGRLHPNERWFYEVSMD